MNALCSGDIRGFDNVAQSFPDDNASARKRTETVCQNERVCPQDHAVAIVDLCLGPHYPIQITLVMAAFALFAQTSS